MDQQLELVKWMSSDLFVLANEPLVPVSGEHLHWHYTEPPRGQCNWGERHLVWPHASNDNGCTLENMLSSWKWIPIQRKWIDSGRSLVLAQRLTIEQKEALVESGEWSPFFVHSVATERWLSRLKLHSNISSQSGRNQDLKLERRVWWCLLLSKRLE